MNSINNRSYDVTVIGGGPAGLAAATSAAEKGVKVLLVEREERLGGVLKQCIHDGFGVIKYGEKLSGCEYACREISKIKDTDVDIWTLTFASEIIKEDDGFCLTLTRSSGMEIVHTKSLVFATGCRERTARQVAIHGSRPAGVITAGSAQYYINVLGQLPGKNCIILGSGDIGLIMARRLTLEGANVIGVYEAKSEPSGLNRNIYQCLTDFDIPLHLSETVVSVKGRGRVESVTVAKVDEAMKPIENTEKEIPCDTLILSVGLIPENELAETLGINMSPATKGAICDETYMTSVPGVFACGNALHVNDLVDYVSESGEKAGTFAAEYASHNCLQKPELAYFDVETSKDFLYAVPEKISEGASGLQDFFFRSKTTRGGTRVMVTAGGKEIYNKKYSALRPPEMEKISIDFTDIHLQGADKIKFEMEDC